MFKPKYTITNNLLNNISRIGNLVNELNNKRFPEVVFLELERIARAISAYASTSIEGNPLPLTEVKKILKNAPANARQSEKEILNYNNALKYLGKTIKKEWSRISLELILTIHKMVMRDLLPKSDIGILRSKSVVVNDPRVGKPIYLPPDGKDVKNLMADLIDFIQANTNHVDSLILSGIFHKQMVLIHPFMDGNGRTTRLATKILLAQMGLNTFNLFSFENYYNQNVTKYFQNVGERGDFYELRGKIDFTKWLEYFTEGIIDELLRVQKILPNITVNPQNELKDYHQKILRFIKNKGFIKDSDYAKITNRAKATRALDFQKLIDLNLIKRNGKGKATYYTNTET